MLEEIVPHYTAIGHETLKLRLKALSNDMDDLMHRMRASQVPWVS